MIVDLFLSFFLLLAKGIWSLVPAWTITPDTPTIQNFKYEMYYADFYFPVSELEKILVVVVAMGVGMIALKFAMSILNLIRGAGA
jgi:hypothetical protein